LRFLPPALAGEARPSSARQAPLIAPALALRHRSIAIAYFPKPGVDGGRRKTYDAKPSTRQHWTAGREGNL